MMAVAGPGYNVRSEGNDAGDKTKARAEAIQELIKAAREYDEAAEQLQKARLAFFNAQDVADRRAESVASARAKFDATMPEYSRMLRGADFDD